MRAAGFLTMLQLLITVIIVGLIFWLIWWALEQIPLPAPFNVVARVILALIAVLVLRGLLLGGGSFGELRLGRLC